MITEITKIAEITEITEIIKTTRIAEITKMWEITDKLHLSCTLMRQRSLAADKAIAERIQSKRRGSEVSGTDPG